MIEISDFSFGIDYIFCSTEPEESDPLWTRLSFNGSSYADVPLPSVDNPVWIRTNTKYKQQNETQWIFYGPIHGQNSELEIGYTLAETGLDDIEIIKRNSISEKIRVKVRIRIKVKIKKPSVTIRKPVQVNMRWRGVIPNVTVKGPDIIIRDLPKIPDIDIGDSIPDSSSIPNVGVFCEVIGGNAALYIQNGESSPVDVWISYKNIITGPINVGPKIMRKINESDYSSCESAMENIFITKAKFA